MKIPFAKRKIIINKIKISTIFLVLFMIIIIAINLLINNKTNILHNLNIIKIIILLVVILIEGSIFLWLYKLISKWLDPKVDKYLLNIKNARRGDNGEKLVFEELNKILDKEQYKIIRNFVIPNKIVDFDFIIIGPKGLIIIEVKNYDHGHIIFNYDKAFYKNKYNSFTNLFRRDPRNKLDIQIKELNSFLIDRGVKDIQIKKVLLYVNPNSIEIKDNAQNIYRTYIVKGLDELKRYFDNCYVDPIFSTEFCREIYEILNNK